MSAEPITLLAGSRETEPRESPPFGARPAEPSPGRRARRFLRPIVLALIAASLVGFGIWLERQHGVDGLLRFAGSSAEDDASPLEDEGPAIDAAEAIMSEDSTRQFVGVVHPGRSTAVTAPFSGHVVALGDVAFGASVAKGDPILTIDSAEARRELKQADMAAREAESEYLKLRNWSAGSEVMQAKREVENARREVQRARQQAERTKALLDEGIVAAIEYEQEMEALRSNEAALDFAIDGHRNALSEGSPERIELARQRFLLAKDEHERLAAAIERQKLVAPQSGILLPSPQRESAAGGQGAALTVGRAVQKGEALVVIGDIETVEVKTFVSDVDIDRLALGQKARIASPAFADREVVGDIRSISKYTADFQSVDASMTEAGPPVSRYEVIIGVAASMLGIVDDVRVGMTVDIEIDVRDAPVR